MTEEVWPKEFRAHIVSKLDEISERQLRMEGKVELIGQSLTYHVKEDAEKFKIQETTIDALHERLDSFSDSVTKTSGKVDKVFYAGLGISGFIGFVTGVIVLFSQFRNLFIKGG